MKLYKLIILAASLDFTAVTASATKTENDASISAFEMLPIEMRLTVNTFLIGREVFAFAHTCTALLDEFLNTAEQAVSTVLPPWSKPPKVYSFMFVSFPKLNRPLFSAVLYVFFLDFLRDTFPQLRRGVAEFETNKDLYALCYLHAAKLNSYAHVRAARQVEIYSGQLASPLHGSFDDAAKFFAKNAVCQQLFYTAEYLMALAYLTPERYYEEMVKCRYFNIGSKFLKRALKFDDPFALLKQNYYVNFALILLQVERAEDSRRRILDLALEKNVYSAELVKEIAKDPSFLRRAFEKKDRSLDQKWMQGLLTHSTPEQLLNANPSGHWNGLQYLLGLKAFEEEEFVMRVPYSLEAVCFLKFMDLTSICHQEAFLNLITRAEADFSSPEVWNSNFCAQFSIFWPLFCQHSRSFPPLNFEHVDRYVKPVMASDLAPRLSFPDFLYFLKPAYWESLTKSFQELDVSGSVMINYSSILPDRRIVRFLPPVLNALLPWPALHLAVLANNYEAVKALLNRPQNQISREMFKETVAGFSLSQLIYWYQKAASGIPEFPMISDELIDLLNYFE